MRARHETEVLISPTIKSERGTLYSGLPPVYLCEMAARLEGARLGSKRSGNFEQVRAKGCATDIPCLNVVWT